MKLFRLKRHDFVYLSYVRFSVLARWDWRLSLLCKYWYIEYRYLCYKHVFYTLFSFRKHHLLELMLTVTWVNFIETVRVHQHFRSVMMNSLFLRLSRKLQHSWKCLKPIWKTLTALCLSYMLTLTELAWRREILEVWENEIVRWEYGRLKWELVLCNTVIDRKKCVPVTLVHVILTYFEQMYQMCSLIILLKF